jgi:hypothetical protein
MNHQIRTNTLKESLIFFVFGHYKTPVTKPAVEEGNTFYDAEGLGVDLEKKIEYVSPS